ncbi:glycoside hydrolase family 99-like domain-containing protein [Rhodosalinus sp. 5P4]|uniref:glycoside hydrolase family 99-like domain-containing protein n=1 Tax=Rhodosalinus sp. 5P4 TaxID=3239196 RepID=UPI003525777C
MQSEPSLDPFSRLARFLRIFLLTGEERQLLRQARTSRLFDPIYYRGAYPDIHPLFHRFPLRHYVVFGESRGYRPNPEFSPAAYLRYNPDVAEIGMSPLLHFLQIGHTESRITKELPRIEELPADVPHMPFVDLGRPRARFAIVLHLYYPELWPEFAETLRRVQLDHDIFVTLPYRGDQTLVLAEEIRGEFPGAFVQPVENRGRDILPFLKLVNSGALDDYEAVCKLHSKKSPHRADGDSWRRHLIKGILPDDQAALVETFVGDQAAAYWVADGQHYTDPKWWGTNLENTRSVLRRIEIEIEPEDLSFPAGSMYWMKPLMIGLLKALQLKPEHFEAETGQVDGTLAHALERAIGALARAAGQKVLQTAELRNAAAQRVIARPCPPSYVSAFYLPQFHPIPENDLWWGKGFTEWRGVVGAKSFFDGHSQPMLPSELGFYDLRLTEVMGQQAELARAAGIDGFCVYHYWFDGRRVLEAPLDRLLERPEIDFPFYLCWANESWRRNWDGLSGTVLIEQSYAPGFEEMLVADSLPYMKDPRYQRPDGRRPRFVIYRPEDLPEPSKNVERMRFAWRKAGVGEVELGAVCFHVAGDSPVDRDVFDFWVEMPPHGLVDTDAYLFGGPIETRLSQRLRDEFLGTIYDYCKVSDRSLSSVYANSLPQRTICGIMPSWDNTARRRLKAHIAYGANPASFNRWLSRLMKERVSNSYRRELIINAWNEWAEKAMLEPTLNYQDLYLKVLAEHLRPSGTKVTPSATAVTVRDPRPSAAPKEA